MSNAAPPKDSTRNLRPVGDQPSLARPLAVIGAGSGACLVLVIIIWLIAPDAASAGAFCFGGVVGWVVSGCYTSLTQVNLTWLTSLIGVIGGALVTTLFPQKEALFGAYCIGLAAAFFPGLFSQGPPGRVLGAWITDNFFRPIYRPSLRNPTEQGAAADGGCDTSSS